MQFLKDFNAYGSHDYVFNVIVIPVFTFIFCLFFLLHKKSEDISLKKRLLLFLLVWGGFCFLSYLNIAPFYDTWNTHIERQEIVGKETVKARRSHSVYINLQDGTRIRVSDEMYKDIHVHDFISKPAQSFDFLFEVHSSKSK